MPIWRTTPASEQPVLTLVDWSVKEVTDAAGTGSVLVGFCLENREARTSSTITSINTETLECTTETGRVYKLQGRPGSSLDAEYVFNNWCRIHRVTDSKDVTAETFPGLVAGGVLRTKVNLQTSR